MTHPLIKKDPLAKLYYQKKGLKAVVKKGNQACGKKFRQESNMDYDLILKFNDQVHAEWKEIILAAKARHEEKQELKAKLKIL